LSKQHQPTPTIKEEHKMNIPVCGADTYYLRAFPISFTSERLARVLRAVGFTVVEIEW
jgi:hypothetical protein